MLDYLHNTQIDCLVGSLWSTTHLSGW